MASACDFRTSEASTKSFFRTKGLIDQYLNIKDLAGFRRENTKWSNYARQQYKVTGRLFLEENNGTKAIPNSVIFKQIDSAKGIFYQADVQDNTLPLRALEEKLNKFFSKTGLTVKQLDTIRDKDGNPMNVIARSDMLEKTIEVVKGKADRTTLPEEASHFFLAMLGEEHLLYKTMMRDITSKQIYLDTYSEYKDIYNGNVEKIKKEAVGKLIGLHIVSQFQGKEIDPRYVAETKSTRNWFARLMDFLKERFKNFGTRELSILNKAADAYRLSAEKILLGETDGLLTPEKEEEFYQLGAEKRTQSGILQALQTVQDKIYINEYIDKEGNPVREYVVNGKTGFKSATEVSKAYAKRKMGRAAPTEKEKAVWAKQAEAGTLSHLINAEVIRRAFPSANRHLSPLDAEQAAKYRVILSGAQQSLQKLIDDTKAAGGVLMAEVKVANHKSKKAGTIDLLRINKDGNADIFDYKTRSTREISHFKLQEYTMQMQEYIKMLEDGDADLAMIPLKVKQRRIIQIRAILDKEFNVKGFSYITELEDKGELSYIPISSERTEIKKIDDLIGKLLNQINIEEGKLTTTSDKVAKDKIRQSIKNKRELIKELQLKRDIRSVLDSAERDLNIIEASIEDKTYNPSLSYQDFIDITRLYANINEYIPGDVNKAMTDEVKERFDGIAGKSSRLYEDLLSIAKEDIKYYTEKYSMLGKGEIQTPDDIFEADKETGFFERFLYGVSSTGNRLIALAKKLTDDALFTSRNNALELKKKIQEALTQLEKHYGKKSISNFEELLQKREDGTLTGKLVDEVKPEYWIKRREATNVQDTKWFIDNTEFDEEAYNRALEYQKQYYESISKLIFYEKYQQARKAFPKKKESDWSAIAEAWTRKQKELNLNDWITKYKSITVYNRAKLTIWKDPRYDNIYKTGNEALRNFYELFRSTIDELREFLPMDISKNFIPNFTANFIELANRVGMKDAARISKTEFLDSLDPKNNEQYFGKFSTFTGEPLYAIPVFGTQHFTDSEGKLVDAEIKSYDLGHVLFLFAESAYRYKELSAVEHVALELKEQLKHQQVIETKGGETRYKTRPVDDATIAQMTDFINGVFYSKSREPEKIAGWADKVLKYTALKNLAFNIFSPAVNALQGQATALITGAFGKYYSTADYIKAAALVTRGPAGLGENTKLSNALIDLMDITFHEFTTEQSLDLSQQKGKRILRSDTGFKLQEWGDDLVQNTILIAMLRSGKYELSFNDFTLNSKGEIEYKGKLSPDEYKVALNEFRQKTMKVAKKVVGNYDADDRMAAKRWLIGRALMQHRTWLPAMFESRFTARKYDYVLDEWFEGRYRLYAKKVGWEILSKRLFTLASVDDLLAQGYTREDIYSMKSNILELYLIAGTWLFLKAISSGDDDKDRKTAFEKYLLRVGNRTFSELTFFLWPGSAMQILISPAAAVSTIQDMGKLMTHTFNEVYGGITGDEELTKKAKPLRQTKRLFPILNQIQRVEENLFDQAEK